MLTQLLEAELSKHYQERKEERGTIIKAQVESKDILGSYDQMDVEERLVPYLQNKLQQKFNELESSPLGQSNNYDLGVIFFLPVLRNGQKISYIRMTTSSDNVGYFFLAVAIQSKLVTVYPSFKLKDEDIIDSIDKHQKREKIDSIKDKKAYRLPNYLVQINVEELFGKAKAPEFELVDDPKKISKDQLGYKVKADYRKNSTFEHDIYKKGKIVDTSAGSSGQGDSRGVVDWVDVAFDKPIVKGGKVQRVVRFNNVLTKSYYDIASKKAIKMNEEKGTCCHKCGHVHVKGTACPKPYLTGKRSCERRKNESIEEIGAGDHRYQNIMKYVDTQIAQKPETAAELAAKVVYFGQGNEDLQQREMQKYSKIDPITLQRKIETFLSTVDREEAIEIEKELGITVDELSTMEDFDSEEHKKLPADYQEGLEYEHFCEACLAETLLEYKDKIEEAEYQGRKVQLGKPFNTPDGPKKRSVYVKNAKGNVVKVNFGDPNMKIKKSNPERRKSFRARHKCDNPGPRWKARYWSCKAW